MRKEEVRRTNADIEREIMIATKKMVEDIGFLKLTLTGIAREAKTGPPVFYNWYNGLDGLLEKFVSDYRYWFADIVDDTFSKKLKEDTKSNFKSMLKLILKEIYKNKSVLQILKWELAEDNPITKSTLNSREIVYNYFLEEHMTSFKKTNLNINIILALLIGGIYYIGLMKDRGKFWNVDFNSTLAKKQLLETLDQICDWVFSHLEVSSEKLIIAKRLKENNIDSQIIAECMELTIEQIKEL